MKATVIILLLCFANQSLAECMANAVRRGSQIPSYWFMSKEPLDKYWNDYVNGKEEPFKKEYDDPSDINQLCLVEVARQFNAKKIDFENSKKVLIKTSCSDLETGTKHRMFIGHYCIEFTDNFYMFLPYEFGAITNKRRR